MVVTEIQPTKKNNEKIRLAAIAEYQVILRIR